MALSRETHRLIRLFSWTIVLTLLVAVWLYRRRPGITMSVDDQLARYGPVVEQRLLPSFAFHNVPYPPAGLALLGFKNERAMEIWAATDSNAYVFVKSYPILALGGKLGPKLREGDGQTPEGIYRIESLNANSHFHLALRIGYPNEFDHLNAQRDRRKNLGGDIMIHGGNASVGCLSMGDEAAEDLFVLAAKTGIRSIVVILSPVDFRRHDLAKPIIQPVWVGTLYAEIKRALKMFPTSSEVGHQT